MNPTRFEEIYRLFLYTIQDFSLKNLFENDSDIAEDMMEVFLLRAIPKFINCRKDIQNVDIDNKTFKDNLDLTEKNILCDLMIITWLDRVINDITQMNLSLTDSDFKHYSEEKNLKEKTEYSDKLREKVSQAMVDYGLLHTPFSQWAVGNYDL